MKKTFSTLVAICGLSLIFACKPNSGGKQTDKANNVSVSIEPPAKTDFKEGEIQVSITTPGSKLGELFGKVDPAKGNIKAQMEKIAKSLSPAEQAELQAESEKNGMMNLAVLMLPIRSVIYVKGDAATAKFDAVTYHGENYINQQKKEGLMYVKSQNSSKEATIRYSGDMLKKMASTDIDSKAYNITPTKETEIIDGYLCTKNIYTLKNPAKKSESINGIPGTSGKVYKLEVWSSKQIPLALNFVHPLYVEEKAGIMKILIQYEQDSKFRILYQFSSVKSRPVTEAEMSIHQTAKVMDFEKSEMAAGLALFGIIMGM